jgi:purine nucleoside phosphorylase
MLISDHISKIHDNPLIGEGMDCFEPMFVDMSDPYSKDTRAKISKIAESIEDVTMHEGVYVA